jgi:hypothetical protein
LAMPSNISEYALVGIIKDTGAFANYK